MALSMLRTIDPQFVALSLKTVLPQINPAWKLTMRWRSSQEMWAEIRPWCIAQDGKLVPEVESALDSLKLSPSMGASTMALAVIRLGAVRWAHKQLGF